MRRVLPERSRREPAAARTAAAAVAAPPPRVTIPLPAASVRGWQADLTLPYEVNLGRLLACDPKLFAAMEKKGYMPMVRANLSAAPALLSPPLLPGADTAARTTAYNEHLRRYWDMYQLESKLETGAIAVMSAATANMSANLTEQLRDEFRGMDAESMVIPQAYQFKMDCQQAWEQRLAEYGGMKLGCVLREVSKLGDFQLAVDDLDEEGAGAGHMVAACLRETSSVRDCLELDYSRLGPWCISTAASLLAFRTTAVSLNDKCTFFRYPDAPASTMEPEVQQRRSVLIQTVFRLVQAVDLQQALGGKLDMPTRWLLKAANSTIPQLVHGAPLAVPSTLLSSMVKECRASGELGQLRSLAEQNSTQVGHMRHMVEQTQRQAAGAAAHGERAERKADDARVEAVLATAAAAKASAAVEQLQRQSALHGKLIEDASHVAAGAQVLVQACREEQDEQRTEVGKVKKAAAAAGDKAEAAQEAAEAARKEAAAVGQAVGALDLKTEAAHMVLATQVRTMARMQQQLDEQARTLARLEAEKENGRRDANRTPVASPLAQACALPTPQLQKRLFSEASEDGQEAAADGAEGGQEQ